MGRVPLRGMVECLAAPTKNEQKEKTKSQATCQQQ